MHSGGEYSELSYKADVKIQSLGNCEHSIQIVRLEGSPEIERHKEALQRNVLLFSYDNGIIENVCPTNTEQQWILNVKKAILSAIQTSTEFVPTFKIVNERDFTGDCETVYTSEESKPDSQIQTIKKEKQLSNCRNHVRAKVPLIPPEILSSAKDLKPLQLATQNCTQEININGIMEKAECTEDSPNVGSTHSTSF
ncbi:uncharacterized protein B4U80_14362, partial [Leptotrombidium deliense]